MTRWKDQEDRRCKHDQTTIGLSLNRISEVVGPTAIYLWSCQRGCAVMTPQSDFIVS